MIGRTYLFTFLSLGLCGSFPIFRALSSIFLIENSPCAIMEALRCHGEEDKTLASPRKIFSWSSGDLQEKKERTSSCVPCVGLFPHVIDDLSKEHLCSLMSDIPCIQTKESFAAVSSVWNPDSVSLLCSSPPLLSLNSSVVPSTQGEEALPFSCGTTISATARTTTRSTSMTRIGSILLPGTSSRSHSSGSTRLAPLVSSFSGEEQPYADRGHETRHPVIISTSSRPSSSSILSVSSQSGLTLAQLMKKCKASEDHQDHSDSHHEHLQDHDKEKHLNDALRSITAVFPHRNTVQRSCFPVQLEVNSASYSSSPISAATVDAEGGKDGGQLNRKECSTRGEIQAIPFNPLRVVEKNEHCEGSGEEEKGILVRKSGNEHVNRNKDGYEQGMEVVHFFNDDSMDRVAREQKNDHNDNSSRRKRGKKQHMERMVGLSRASNGEGENGSGGIAGGADGGGDLRCNKRNGRNGEKRGKVEMVVGRGDSGKGDKWKDGDETETVSCTTTRCPPSFRHPLSRYLPVSQPGGSGDSVVGGLENFHERLFPSLDGTIDLEEFHAVASTPSTDHHRFPPDSSREAEERGGMGSRGSSQGSMNFCFYANADDSRNEEEEEEEERRILAAVGTTCESHENITHWRETRENEEKSSKHPGSFEKEREVPLRKKKEEAQQVGLPSGDSALLQKRKEEEGEHLLASLLRRVLGHHRLDHVTNAELRVDVRDIVGVDRLHKVLPSLVSLRLNLSWIPSIHSLGGPYYHLKILWLHRCHLESLQGVGAQAPLLTELYVAFNHISDLSPLLGVCMTLEVLDIEGNEVGDITSLQAVLTSLRRVHTLTFQGNPAEEHFVHEVLRLTPPVQHSPATVVLLGKGRKGRQAQHLLKQQQDEKEEHGEVRRWNEKTQIPNTVFKSINPPCVSFSTTTTMIPSLEHATMMPRRPIHRRRTRASHRVGSGEVKDFQDVFGAQNPMLRFRHWVEQVMPWLQYLDDIPTFKHMSQKCSDSTAEIQEELKSDDDGEHKVYAKEQKKEHDNDLEEGKKEEKEWRRRIYSKDIKPAGEASSLTLSSPGIFSPSSLRTTSFSSSCSSSSSFLHSLCPSSPTSLTSPVPSHPNSFPSALPYSSCTFFSRQSSSHEINKDHKRVYPSMPTVAVGTASSAVLHWKRRSTTDSCTVMGSTDSSAVREELRFLQECIRDHGFDVLQQTLLEQNDCVYPSRPFTPLGSGSGRCRAGSSAKVMAVPADFSDSTTEEAVLYQGDRKGGGGEEEEEEADTVGSDNRNSSRKSELSLQGSDLYHEGNISLVKEVSRGVTTTPCCSMCPEKTICRNADKGDTQLHQTSRSVLSDHYFPVWKERVRKEENLEQMPRPCLVSDTVSHPSRDISLKFLEPVGHKSVPNADREEEQEEEEEWDELKLQLLRKKLCALEEQRQQRMSTFHFSDGKESKECLTHIGRTKKLPYFPLSHSLLSHSGKLPDYYPRSSLSSAFPSSYSLMASRRSKAGHSVGEPEPYHSAIGWDSSLRLFLPPHSEEKEGESIMEQNVKCYGQDNMNIKSKFESVKACGTSQSALLESLLHGEKGKNKKAHYRYDSRWRATPSKYAIPLAEEEEVAVGEEKEEEEEEKDFKTFLKEQVIRTRAAIAREGAVATGIRPSKAASKNACYSVSTNKWGRNDDQGGRSKDEFFDVIDEAHSKKEALWTHSTRSPPPHCCFKGRYDKSEQDFFADEGHFEVVEVGAFDHFFT